MAKTRHFAVRDEETCEDAGGEWDAENEVCMMEAAERASTESKSSHVYGSEYENDRLDKRNVIVAAMRQVLDSAETEKRSLTGEEQGNYDKMVADMETLEKEIRDRKRTIELRSDFDDRERRARETGVRVPVHTRIQPSEASAKFSKRASPEYAEAFTRALRSGRMEEEFRALAINPDQAGGYTVPPEQWLDALIHNVDDDVLIRTLATVIRVDRAVSVAIPTRDNDISDATWGVELQVATADTALTFGKRALFPHPLTAQILVSKLLALQSSIDIDAFVRQRMAYKFGVTMEKGYLAGSGALQPLGLFIADPNGLSTTRDIVTFSSSGNVTADNLIATLWSLKPQYQRNATWLLHRNKLQQVRQLKDANNNYIWQPAGFQFAQGAVGGSADTIIGRPYYQSEYAPNSTASTTGTGTLATGYSAIVGDFKQGYYIVDSAELGVNMYDQVNAASNQNTYIGLFQTDGQPVLPEAFARARLST